MKKVAAITTQTKICKGKACHLGKENAPCAKPQSKAALARRISTRRCVAEKRLLISRCLRLLNDIFR